LVVLSLVLFLLVNVKKRRISTDTKAPIGGCIICRKDNNYSKMLLCDKCDKECHTYCQYPILWSVPDGEWFCPLCREVSTAIIYNAGIIICNNFCRNSILWSGKFYELLIFH
jgi:hypothetical protein